MNCGNLRLFAIRVKLPCYISQMARCLTLLYLVSVWLLVPFPLGFWLFVLGAGRAWALQASNRITYVNARSAMNRKR